MPPFLLAVVVAAAEWAVDAAGLAVIIPPAPVAAAVPVAPATVTARLLVPVKGRVGFG